jgi:flagellum-specific ATP synthase
VVTKEHKQTAGLVRKMLATYARSEDLVRIGAYKPGTDADLDRAMRSRSAIRAFLEQDAAERVSFSACRERLAQMAAGV